MGQIDTLIASSETLNTSQPRLTEMQRLHKLHAKPYRNTSGGVQTNYQTIYNNGHDATSDLPTGLVATSANFSRLLGIIVSEDGGDVDNVATGQTGFYVDEGFIQGPDLSSFADNDLLWLHASAAGSLQATPIEGQPPVAYVIDNLGAAAGLLYFRASGIHPAGTLTGTLGSSTGNPYTQRVVLALGTVNATKNAFIMVTNSRIRVTQCSFVVATTTVSDATNRWEFQLRNQTGALNLLSAVFNTNGNDLTADTVKDITPNQNQNIPTLNSVLEVQMVKFAAGVDLVDLSVILEYQPI